MRVVFRDRRCLVLRQVSVLILSLFAALIGYASDFGSVLNPLAGPDGLLYDLSVSLASLGHSEPWPDVVVVSVDRESLQDRRLVNTPRALFQPIWATAIDGVLELGARKVGLDFVVALDPSSFRPAEADLGAYDLTWRETLVARRGKLVLGAFPNVLPVPRYADEVGVFGVGLVDLQEEPDGVIRSAPTRLFDQGGRLRLTFPFALAAPVRADDIEIPSHSRFLMFPRAPVATIPMISLASLLTCLESTQGRQDLTVALAGKTVLIGSGVRGEDEVRGPDRFMFDRSEGKARSGTSCEAGASDPGKGSYVPGVFLQAAAVQSLLSRSDPALADDAVRSLANFILALMAGQIFSLILTRMQVWPLSGGLLPSSVRAFSAISCGVAVLIVVTLLLDVSALLLAKTWLPLSHTLVLICVMGIAVILGLAIRRDLAITELKLRFGRFVPTPVVEASFTDKGSAALLGQERTISVLMADLKGFTNFCHLHRGNPTFVVKTINERFDAIQILLDKHEACLDKFDGDAVLAFWNGASDQTDHCERSVAAARDIVAANPETLPFKVAVATGFAFVGVYGSERKSNFSAIGEPVNVAARLEKFCSSHGLDCAICERTVQGLRDRDGVRALGDEAKLIPAPGLPALAVFSLSDAG